MSSLNQEALAALAVAADDISNAVTVRGEGGDELLLASLRESRRDASDSSAAPEPRGALKAIRRASALSPYQPLTLLEAPQLEETSRFYSSLRVVHSGGVFRAEVSRLDAEALRQLLDRASIANETEKFGNAAATPSPTSAGRTETSPPSAATSAAPPVPLLPSVALTRGEAISESEERQLVEKFETRLRAGEFSAARDLSERLQSVANDWEERHEYGLFTQCLNAVTRGDLEHGLHLARALYALPYFTDDFLEGLSDAFEEREQWLLAAIAVDDAELDDEPSTRLQQLLARADVADADLSALKTKQTTNHLVARAEAAPDATTLHALTNHLYSCEENAEALRWATQFTEHYPSDPYSWLWLAKTQQRAAEAGPSGAEPPHLSTLRLGLSRLPSEPLLLLELAEATSHAGDNEAATRHFFAAYEVTRDGHVLRQLCEHLRRVGSPDLAPQLELLATMHSPCCDREEVAGELASLYRAAGDKARAARWAGRARQRHRFPIKQTLWLLASGALMGWGPADISGAALLSLLLAAGALGVAAVQRRQP